MKSALVDGYAPTGVDEMVGTNGRPAAAYADLLERLGGWGPDEFRKRQGRADLALLNAGITFTVYADEAGTERVFPFSLIPRMVAAGEWARIEAGLHSASER